MKRALRSTFSPALAPALALAVLLGAGTNSYGRSGDFATKAPPAGPAGGGLTTVDLTTALTPLGLAQKIVGEGITISNVTFSGANVAGGTFAGGTGILAFESGIVLSSGSVSNIIGPNVSDSISGSNGTPGDADLTDLSQNPTFDAAILEFDFVPNGDKVSFEYVFGSDEYNEFVNSNFNDVFGFFVNGTNCALVGSPSRPVSINTINNGNPFGSGGPNANLFLNNDLDDGGPFINTEMDGVTRTLTCKAFVTPNATNHIKLAIADSSDTIFDSNVLLREGSFSTSDPPLYREHVLDSIYPGGGIPMGWHADDACWNFDMPITFNYYGTDHSAVAICSDGFIDFTSNEPDFSGSEEELRERRMIAPLWEDLRTDQGGDIYIYQPTASTLSIRWEAVKFDPSNPVNVQLILDASDGSISFFYGSGNTLLHPTVGISEGSDLRINLGEHNEKTTLTNAAWLRFIRLDSACPDGDLDGYATPGSAACPKGPAEDCDDNNDEVNPGAAEIPLNGIDDDCDPTTPPLALCQQSIVSLDAEVTAERAEAGKTRRQLAPALLLIGAAVHWRRRRSSR